MSPVEEERVTILFVDHSPSHGGSVESLSRLIKGMDHGRFHPVVVASHEQRKRDLFAGVEIEVVPLRPSVSTVIPFLQRLMVRSREWNRYLSLCISGIVTVFDFLFNEFPRLIRLRGVCRHYTADLIHLNNSSDDLAAILTAKWFKLPCISHHRDFEWNSPRSRWLAARVDHHIAISGEIKKNLMDLGIDEKKITILHDPVDQSEFDPKLNIENLVREFGKQPNELFFGLFGRVVEWKGQAVFLNAAAEVFKKVPNSRAFIVGDTAEGPPDYLEDLKESARKLGITSKVIFTGFRQDVPAMMKLMDVVVHASIRPEPFGMVVAEAMTMEKPVVATSGGGILDMIEDGMEGLLVPLGDSQKMADAIIRLLEGEALRRSMGKRGKEKAFRMFSLEAISGRLGELYLSILSDKVPGLKQSNGQFADERSKRLEKV